MGRSLGEFINEYAKNARIHGDATAKCNHKLANRSYDKLIKALAGIREFGDAGNEALLGLTQQENKSIKCWAATHSLKYAPDKSENVLKELSGLKGPIGFDAKTVLEEWTKGSLQIP